MLTLANASGNYITSLDGMGEHIFLECLLLGRNRIDSLRGIEKLKYLQVNL